MAFGLAFSLTWLFAWLAFRLLAWLLVSLALVWLDFWLGLTIALEWLWPAFGLALSRLGFDLAYGLNWLPFAMAWLGF